MNLNSCDVLGSAIIPNDEEMRQEVMATAKKIIATSLAVQSEINPLNPIISPKNMVTHSKCSANAVASPPFEKHFLKFAFINYFVFTLFRFMSLTTDVGRKS